MSNPVTWGDLFTIAKWYVAVSIGCTILGIAVGLLWAWWENRK